MDERLPERPKPDDVLRVQAQYRAERQAAADLETARARQQVPKPSERKSEEPRNVKSFPLTGFFDKIQLEEMSVGKHLLVQVPSVADMEMLFEHIAKSDVQELTEIDKRFNTNFRDSFKKVSFWVEKGSESLRRADYYFTRGQTEEARAELEDGKGQLAVAQQISEALGKQYYPEHYPETNQELQYTKVAPGIVLGTAHVPPPSEIWKMFSKTPFSERYHLWEAARRVQINCTVERSATLRTSNSDQVEDGERLDVLFRITEKGAERNVFTSGTITRSMQKSPIITIDALPWRGADIESQTRNQLASLVFEQAARSTIGL